MAAVAETALAEALELKRAGRLDEAVIALEAVLARPAGGGGAEAVALVHLAEVQFRRRRLPEAAEALERAEAMAGVSAWSARVRGDLRYREKRFSEAAGAYREACALGERGPGPSSSWVGAACAPATWTAPGARRAERWSATRAPPARG